MQDFDEEQLKEIHMGRLIQVLSHQMKRKSCVNSMKITIAKNPISMIIHVKNIPNKVKLCETAIPECDKIILMITASPSTPEP